VVGGKGRGSQRVFHKQKRWAISRKGLGKKCVEEYIGKKNEESEQEEKEMGKPG